MRSQKSKKGSRQKRGPSKGRVVTVREDDEIPPLRLFGPVRRITRYIATAAGLFAIDAKEVILSGGAICTVVNTTLTAVFSGVKINRVRVWCPLQPTIGLPIANVATQICLLWGQTASAVPGSTQLLTVATTLSSVHPAFIESRPPPGSTASWWNQVDSTDNLLQLFSYSSLGAIANVPTGTIVEMDCSFTAAVLGTTTTLTVASGVLGQSYWPALNNSGSNTFVPVGLPSTF